MIFQETLQLKVRCVRQEIAKGSNFFVREL